MIIDVTYFINEIVIQDLETSGSQTGAGAMLAQGRNEAMNMFIAKYESEFLKKLLGKELADAFRAGLKEDPISEKWGKLKSLLIDEELKISPIANYVYYWYKRNASSTSTSLGEVKANQSYAINVSEANKMVRAYNEMCDQIEEFHSLIVWLDYGDYYKGMTGYDELLGVRINTFNL